MRERESLFNEYILEVRKREKEEKVQKRDQVRLSQNFLLFQGYYCQFYLLVALHSKEKIGKVF